MYLVLGSKGEGKSSLAPEGGSSRWDKGKAKIQCDNPSGRIRAPGLQTPVRGRLEPGTASRWFELGKTGVRVTDLQPHRGLPFPLRFLYLLSMSVYLLQGAL